MNNYLFRSVVRVRIPRAIGRFCRGTMTPLTRIQPTRAVNDTENVRYYRAAEILGMVCTIQKIHPITHDHRLWKQ